MSNVKHLPKGVWAVAAVIGLSLAALGPLLILVPLLFPGDLDPLVVMIASVGWILLVLGISLVWAAVGGWQGREAQPFYSKWAWGLFAGLSLVFGVVGLLLPDAAHTSVAFAPIHFALITFPALLLLSLLALVVGREQAMALRRAVVTVAGGASSVLLAVPVEIVGLLISGGIGAAFTLLLPSGQMEMERLVALLMRWAERPPTDESAVLSLVASPFILITLALTLGVVTPVIEELGKTLVMGLMGIWVRPSRLTAFLWGAACGLGFAWFEGVSNGALGLGESVGWASSVGVRLFATAMHMLASGILGLGWYEFWAQRWWLLLVSYVVAVVIHGLWNLNVIFSLAGIGLSETSPSLGRVVTVSGGVIQGGLILFALVALYAIPWAVRRRERV